MKWAALLALPILLAAETPGERAAQKIDRIYNGQAKPGEVFVFTPEEANAWSREKLPTVVPQGIRNVRIDLGEGTASASALVDFLKIREGLKLSTNSLFAALLQGERPMKAAIRVTSGGGKCTVYLTRVELGGTVVEGTTLDYLIRDFFRPLFPGAKIDQQFDLDFRIEKIEVHPDGVRVTIGR